MGTGPLSRVVWRLVAALVLVGLVMFCVLAIVNDANDAVVIPLQISSGHYGLPKPSGGTASITDYDVNQVTVTMTHLSAQLKSMLVARTIIQFLLVIGAFLTIGIVLRRASDGKPFAWIVTISLFALAIEVAVLGTAKELLDTFIEQREVFEAIGSNQLGTYASTFGGFHLGLVSLLIAAGIAILGSAFAIGARLTTETARLAVETARLQRETEGLV